MNNILSKTVEYVPRCYPKKRDVHVQEPCKKDVASAANGFLLRY